MPQRSFLLTPMLALAILALGAVLLTVAWLIFGFEVALGVLVVTLTAAVAATLARLLLTDDVT